MSTLWAADQYGRIPRPPRVFKKPSKMSFMVDGNHKHLLTAEWVDFIGCYMVRHGIHELGGFRPMGWAPQDEFIYWVRQHYAYDKQVFEHLFNHVQEEGPELAKEGKPTGEAETRTFEERVKALTDASKGRWDGCPPSDEYIRQMRGEAKEGNQP